MDFNFSTQPSFDFEQKKNDPQFRASIAIADEAEALASPQFNWKSVNDGKTESPLFSSPSNYHVKREQDFVNQYSEAIAQIAGSSEYAPNETYGQIEMAAGLSAMSGIDFKDAMNIIKGGSLQIAQGINYQRPKAVQTMVDQYLQGYYRNRAGVAYTLYTVFGDESELKVADRFYEKSLTFKTSDKGNGWFADYALTPLAKTAGTSSGGGLASKAILGAGAGLSVITANPAFFAAAKWVSKVYMGLMAGSSQAGAHFYELSKEMDRNGMKMDMSSPAVKGLFALDLLLMGGIEVGLMEWTPSYRMMTNILTPQAISQQFAVSAGRGFVRSGGEFLMGVFSEAGEEYYQGVAEDTLTNLVYAWSNSHNGTEFPIKDWQSVIYDASKAFASTTFEMLPTVALSTAIGMGSQAVKASKASKNQTFSFNPNTKQGVIDSRYIGGYEQLKKEVEKEESEKASQNAEKPETETEEKKGKVDRIKLVQTDRGGVMATEEDRENLKELIRRNLDKDGFEVIVEAVDIENLSAENRVSVMNLLGNIANEYQEDGDVLGYTNDGRLVVRDREALERVASELSDPKKANLLRADEDTVVLPFRDGKSTRIGFITEHDAKVQNVAYNTVSTWQFWNRMFRSAPRLGEKEWLRQKEITDSMVFLVRQVTGMKREEVVDALKNDMDSITEKLPVGVTWDNLTEGAVFMPIMSEITDRSIEELASENLIQINATGETVYVDRETQRKMTLNRDTGKVELRDRGGQLLKEYDPNDTEHVARSQGDTDTYESKDRKKRFTVSINKDAEADTVVHELMHVTRALAPKAKLSGFIDAYGSEDLWTDDIVDNGNGTWTFNGKTYGTRAEAYNTARVNEERFVRDFMHYLYDGEAPNEEIRSFFNELKNFMQKFLDAFRDRLSEDTVRAFEKLLNGEVDPDLGDTVEEAIENSELTLMDEYPQKATSYVDDEDMYDEEGNPLYSLASEEIQKKFETEETVKAFRTMQVIDGGLYPPKATFVNKQKGEPLEIGKAYQSDERPDIAYLKTLKDGTEKYVFDLNDGKGTLKGVDYNPYFHSSTSPFNDQFTGAINRPNQVLVEVEILKSDLESGYKADKANKTVGETPWHSGSLSAKLKAAGKGERTILLSRYIKIDRIVPEAEVASMMKDMLEGTDFSVDVRTVTPSLRSELEKVGVDIGYRDTLHSLADDKQWQVMDANTQRRIDADYDRIYNQYYGTDKWMKAPNGKPTNLTERQWVIVRTPAFKAWFGDWENDPENASKAVDNNGEPLVLYHGTGKRKYGFDVFKTDYENTNLGAHFGGKSAAEVFADGDATIYNVFLNIKNPLSVEDVFAQDHNFEEVHLAARLAKQTGSEAEYNLIKSHYPWIENYVDLSDEDFYMQVADEFGELYDWERDHIVNNRVTEDRELYKALSSLIKKAGYDGLVYTNQMEGDYNEKSWVVLDPNQIKSATDNVGAFSADNDSILYSLVYHGSGADFDELLESKIGSGEGRQNFGHGFYLSESDLVGKEYAARQQFSQEDKDYKLSFYQGQIGKYTAELERDRKVLAAIEAKEGELWKQLLEKTKERIARALKYDSPVFEVYGNDAERYLTEQYKKSIESSIRVTQDIIDQNRDSLEEYTNKDIQRRNLYKFEIPDDTGKNYFDWDRMYAKAEIKKIVDGLKKHLPAEERARFEQDYGFDDVNLLKGENIYNTIDYVLGGADKASDFLADLGYVGNVYLVDPSGKSSTARNYVIYPKNKDQIKMVNHWTYDTDAEAERLYSIKEGTFDEVKQYIDTMPEAERERISKNLEQHKGTPWYYQTLSAALARRDMEALINGKEIPSDSFLYKSAKSKDGTHAVIEALKKGKDGVFGYVSSHSLVANSDKALFAINGSTLDCNPTPECAEFCYVTDGQMNYPTSIIKAEMVALAIRLDPIKAARMAAIQYKFQAGYDTKLVMRMFDRGDFSAEYVPFIKELNRQGVGVQIFTKRPDFLYDIDRDRNVVMMSIDHSNLEQLEKYPDLPIAIVYQGKEDAEIIKPLKERFEKYKGVILPVKIGRKYVSKKDIMALPQWARVKFTCNIDRGLKTIDNWNCRKCDLNGINGCFFGRGVKNRELVGRSIEDISIGEIYDIIGSLKDRSNAVQELIDRGIDIRNPMFGRVLEELLAFRNRELERADGRTADTTGQKSSADTGRESEASRARRLVGENNRIVDDFASQFPNADIVELDGVKYIKHSNDTYTDDELRSIKDSVSETLHSIKGGQLELDFSGQLELDFDGDQGNGSSAQMGERGNVGGTAGAPVADLRGLRPSVARYFSWDKGWNGQEPSSAIDNQWDNLGYISFIGTEVRSPEDIAKLYSVYRNPKLEYYHMVFTKGDRVVGHMAMSTGLPFSSYAIPIGGPRRVDNYMSAIGADGYYMMHNHPSGRVEFSDADENLTNYYRNSVGGYRGHIILDHNKFGFFDEKMKFDIRNIEGMHEASEKKLTSGFEESYYNVPNSFVSKYVRAFDKPTFSIFYMDYDGRIVDIEDRTDIPTRNYLNDRMKKGFHTYAVGVTNDDDLFERMRAEAYFAKPKYNFDYVIRVEPSAPAYFESFGGKKYFNTNVWGYVKGSKKKSGVAFIPKFEHDDDADTLYSLSPERKAEYLQQRKNQIRQALEFGAFVRTEYLEEFRGEDWADEELAIRDFVKDNPEVLEKARKAKSVADFRKKFLAGEQKADEDDDIPFDEPEGFDDEDEFQEDASEDEKALKEDSDRGEHWYERIYGLAHAQTAEARDRQFVAEWTASEDKTIELGKILANYKDVGYASRPNSRSGGFHYVRNVWGAFSGVSTKVTRLRDGKGTRTSQRQRSSSEEIQEAQRLIRENPRPYRNALRLVEAASARVGDFESQRPIGESADWMEMDYIDEDIASEMEKLEEAESEKKDQKRAEVSKTGEYRKKYEDLKKQMDDAIADLKKANEGLKSNVQQLQDRVASLNEQIKDYEKQMADAEKEVDDIIGRMGEKIENLQEKAKKASALKGQLKERRARVEELRAKLSEANKEKKRVQNALDAMRRWKEAKGAADYRRKRIKQIIRNATFNSNTLDAAFEEPLTWIQMLFARNEEDMAFRKDVQNQIDSLKAEIEQRRYSGEDAKELKQRLIALQKIKKYDSMMLEPPTIVSKYLPEGYLARRDNRQSAWTAEELDTILDAVKLMHNDARVLKQTRDARRKTMLMGIAYDYFRQVTGHSANLSELGQKTVGALKESVLGMTEKQFGKVKGAWLSYHLYKAKMQRIARLVDGDREGVFYDWFVRKNYEHQTEELKGINKRLDLGDKMWKNLGLKNGELAKEGFRSRKNNGTEYSLTRGQMIGVYVYAQSDLGYEKLTSPEGNDFSETDVASIISQLTDKERAWADFLLSEMQSNWIRLADIYYRVWNRNLGQRPAYFPLVGAEGRTIEQKDADLLCGQVEGKDGKSYVDKGFTKEVNPNALYPLNLDVTATWNKQVRRQEHFIAYGEWARDSQYLLDKGQLGETITRIFGPQFAREINRSVNHVISNYITTGTDFDRTITKYFSARNAASLAASLSTALKQLGSVGAITENEGDITKAFVGDNFFRNFLKANAELNAEYGNVKNVRQFIYENAPDIRNRQVDFEVMAYLNRVYGGQVSNAIQRTTDRMMKYTTNLMDKLVVERLWLARYYTEFENLRNQGWTTAKAHKEASFKASQLISETQPTSMRMDQSGQQIEAQKSTLLRMISVFTNQAMNLSNMIMLDMPMAFRQKNWRKVVGIVSSVLINVGIVALVSGRFIRKGDEDDKEYRWRLAREILGTVAQTVDPVWGGNFLEGVIYPFTGGSYLNEFTEIGGVFRSLMSPSEDKSGWEKMVDALEDLGGEALQVSGIPSKNLLKPLKAVTEKNAGYLLNSTWADIIESYR